MGYFIETLEENNPYCIDITPSYTQLNLEGFLTYAYHPLKVYRSDNGELQDLRTEGEDKLNFDLEHPVDILPQTAYDQSVNLILNDNKNIPRLINTRFSVEGGNRYKIIDRDGDNDTNIYDDSQFKLDSSLTKLVSNLVDLTFSGLTNDGNLLCGNYAFYFKLADADGNLTDFVEESGIVSCHLGNINDPQSIRGGIQNENSFKSVNFTITNIDPSYSQVIVYYTRWTSDEAGSQANNSYRIIRPYYVSNGLVQISVTGFEDTVPAGDIELNMRYALIDSAKTLTQCENMLFLGNIKEPVIPFKELLDLSLRFLPTIDDTETIGYVDHTYKDVSKSTHPYEYYNVDNIYHRLGYWNDEIYRFGIVYILPNGLLTPVFNVRGNIELTSLYNYTTDIDVYDEQDQRLYIHVDKNDYFLTTRNENSKGLVRIKYEDNQFNKDGIKVLGVKFKISSDALQLLKTLTKGFFFVRLKRLKLTLCQALTIGLDNVGKFPIIPINNGGYIAERFLDDDRELTHEFSKRIFKGYSEEDSLLGVKEGIAALCPEYELNQALYNQMFTGADFVATDARIQPSSTDEGTNDGTDGFVQLGESNYFYVNSYKNNTHIENYKYVILAVPDDINVLKGRDQIFSSRCGDAADAYKVSYCSVKNKSDEANNLIRGSFGPYLGMESIYNNRFKLLNIKIPDYDESSMDNYIDIRAKDASEFFAISYRYTWDKLDKLEIPVEDDNKLESSGEDGTSIIYETPTVFRGDCFIGNFTHRMNRNFQDPETPINDEIVNKDTWKDDYRLNRVQSSDKGIDDEDPEDLNEVNRGDVNAVQIGHWVTFKVCSSTNISFRTLDYTNLGEYGLTGKPRGFYPLLSRDVSGESKIPESSVSNTGYNANVSRKIYELHIEAPSYRNIFSSRIYYSLVASESSFINNYRVFTFNSYKDYPLQYGSITKLMEFNGHMFCIFEHGVCMIPLQSKSLQTNLVSGDVFLKSSELIMDPYMLSDCFGSQWPDSVIKTQSGIYGVDTVAKKIWRIAVEGSLRPSFKLKSISDLKVQSFLNNNISLLERETDTIIGLKNVKSHYNRFKSDVMFTFYDDTNSLQDKVWNLCFNEALDTFTTFYSWIPSFSENIDNVFFSFDRDVSNKIASLYNNVNHIRLVDEEGKQVTSFSSDQTTKSGSNLDVAIGTLKLFDVPISNYEWSFKIVNDVQNYPFSIGEDDILYYHANNNFENTFYKLPIKATITIKNTTSTDVGATMELESTISLKLKDYALPSAYFWKHGQAGLFKTSDKLLPTKWYGKQHPFEYEVVVATAPQMHKIFTNLEILSNKAAPESLHFEITGEVYNFADEKETIFFRQEATKNLYQFLGGSIDYDQHYLDITPEQKHIPYSHQCAKSTIFPLYYSRVDTLDDVEDYYQSKNGTNVDYLRMSGTEVIYDKINREYRLVTHVKGCPIGKYYRQLITLLDYDYLKTMGYKNIDEDGEKYYVIELYGRLNGNLKYQEDKWQAQIPSIVYRLKNEDTWRRSTDDVMHTLDSIPPLNVGNSPLPESMPETVTVTDLPSNLKTLGYDCTKDLDISSWDNYLKETRLRDRYIKIRIRYSGEDLAVIYALKTLFTISYS